MRARKLLSIVLLAAAMTFFGMPAAIAQGATLIEPTGQVTVEKGDEASFGFVIWDGEGTNYDYWVVLEKPNGREIQRFHVGSIYVSTSPSYQTATWTATLHPGWFGWRLYVGGYGDTEGERLRITHPAHER